MDISVTKPKDWVVERINLNIKNGEMDKLLEALPVAEEYEVDAALLEKGWKLCGDYLFSKNEWLSSILAYNKVRKHNPALVYAYDKIIESVNAFYTENKTEFSKGDLSKFIPTIQAILDFYKQTFTNTPALENGNELLHKLKTRFEFIAEDLPETKVTFRVNQIVNALDKDVPMEQVYADVAKILTPLIREKLREKESAKEKSEKDTKPKT